MRKIDDAVRLSIVASVLLFMLLAPGAAVAQTPTSSTNASDGQAITRQTFTELAKKVIPSVVTVYVRRDLTKSMTPEQKQQYDQLRKFFEDPFLKQFLPPGMSSPGKNNDEEGGSIIMRGSGSGVIVSADGYIVTNWHVVGDKKDKTEIRIVFSDNTELGGKDIELLDSSQLIDLALLKVKRTGLTPIKLGDSEKVQIGDWVAAVGSPLELKKTITQGIISAKHRELGSGLGDMLQTDAAINPGSSGGALVNLDGELIGINRMIATMSEAGTWAGYGFSIPSNQVKYYIDQVKTTGKISFGYIGMAMAGAEQDTTKLRESLGFNPDQKGVLVMSVTPNGPAAKAGLQEGDMITAVDGHEVNDPTDLLGYVVRRPVGSTIKVNYLRPAQGGGQAEAKTAEVKVITRPSEEALAKGLEESPSPGQNQSPSESNKLGVQVEPYRDKSNQGLKVTAVMPGSPADKAGIKPGDVLLKLNWKTLASEADLAQALKGSTPGKPEPLYILRDGQKFLVPIE